MARIEDDACFDLTVLKRKFPACLVNLTREMVRTTFSILVWGQRSAISERNRRSKFVVQLIATSRGVVAAEADFAQEKKRLVYLSRECARSMLLRALDRIPVMMAREHV